jgi:hypothetical protein
LKISCHTTACVRPIYSHVHSNAPQFISVLVRHFSKIIFIVDPTSQAIHSLRQALIRSVFVACKSLDLKIYTNSTTPVKHNISSILVHTASYSFNEIIAVL